MAIDDAARPETPAIRGHRALEVLPEIDVAEIATSVYDFLSGIRRLMERPNQKLEISQSEIEVLQFISQHPGCGVSDIARLRFLRASNVSATVRRLINNGFVLRKANDQDKRAQDLYLTDDGIEMMNSITDEWALLIARATNRMDARDIAKLRRGVPALRNLSIAAETLIDDIQRRQE
ncbi:MarR family winged helix-turn-helix transcriptional regulator [Corynebacterium auriscanis]|uniref:MarR family winged helix-turn-helix transcriptional regulator n=1 Tax=Corynebacterium auriscanis TaxID=99807 RepID=UPI00068A1628|nr:MarR family transcriptional regulator [Corynebacterium auriscanis]WJY72033.1 MarR family protein [Corynebacterium auriscanis]